MNCKTIIFLAVVFSVDCLLMAMPCHAFGPPDHECSVSGNGCAHCVTRIRRKDGSWSYYESYINKRTGVRWSRDRHSWEIEEERRRRAEPGPMIVNPYVKNAKANLLDAQLNSTNVRMAKKDNWIVNPYYKANELRNE